MSLNGVLHPNMTTFPFGKRGRTKIFEGEISQICFNDEYIMIDPYAAPELIYVISEERLILFRPRLQRHLQNCQSLKP